MATVTESIDWPSSTPRVPTPDPYVSPYTPWITTFTIPVSEPDEVIITRADNGWSVKFNGNQLSVFTNYQEMVRFLSERWDQLDEEEDEDNE